MQCYSLRKVFGNLKNKYSSVGELRVVFFSIQRAALKKLFAEVEAKREIP